jgi:iron complex outermembrane receptor protein
MVHSGFSATGALVVQPTLNPFAIAAGITPGSLNNVLTNELIHGDSKLDAVDATVNGTLGKLPAGSPAFAVGIAWRKEALSGAPDANAFVHVGGTLAGAPQSLYTGGQGADPFAASRNILSQYMEVRVPLASTDWNVPGFAAFDLIGAVRHEHYSDAGNSTVPKFGFRWQPISEQVTVRGSFAKSFTAPSLYAESGPLNIRQGGPMIITNAFPLGIAGTTQVEDGNNPNLNPAKSDSVSLGLVLKPNLVPHLTVDVEYSDVKETGQPAGIGFNNILLDVNANGAGSIFSGNIARNAFPGSPGALAFTNPQDVLAYVTNPANVVGGNYPNLYMIDRFTNLGVIKIRSLNVSADYNTPTANAGTFSIGTQVAVLLSYQFQAIPGQPIYEFAGTTTQGGGAQGTLPRLRSYTTADWNVGHWDAGLGHSFIASVRDIGTGGLSYDLNFNRAGQTSFFSGHVPAFQSWDMHLSYRGAAEGSGAKGLTVTAGVNNIADEMPPVSTNINAAVGAAAGSTAWRAENNTDVSTFISGENMKIGLLLATSAALVATAAIADDYIPPVVGGRTWTQHLVEAAKAHHREIQSIVVTGLRDQTKDYVVLGSTLGETTVFGKAPIAADKDSAMPSKDGQQFVVRKSFLSNSDHRLGTIELRFPYKTGQATAGLEAVAKAVQAELRLSTLSAKNAIDPYPYDAAYSDNTYAQVLTENTVRAHPDLLVMMIHATPPGKPKNVIIGSNIGRFGKEADEDDLRVIDKGSTNLEVGGDKDRFETELPLNDASGKRIGALGLVFPYHEGQDKEALHAHGRAIRDEIAKGIPNNAALFAPR